MPAEVRVYSPDPLPNEIPVIAYATPPEVIFPFYMIPQADLAQRKIMSVGVDENDDSVFIIGTAFPDEAKDGTISAEIVEERELNKHSIVIEPLPNGGLAYVSWVPAVPYEFKRQRGF